MEVGTKPEDTEEEDEFVDAEIEQISENETIEGGNLPQSDPESDPKIQIDRWLQIAKENEKSPTEIDRGNKQLAKEEPTLNRSGLTSLFGKIIKRKIV